MTKTDTVSALIADINGLSNAHVRAAINGNLPNGWVVDSLSAIRTFRDPPVVVNATIGQPMKPGHLASLMNTVGVQVAIGAPQDLLQLADAMSVEATAKIRAARGGIRIALAP